MKKLKDLIQQTVLDPMDHRFLNHEVPPFDKIVPTTENVAAEIWRRLEPHFEAGRARLNNVRLYETEDLYVDYAGESPIMRVTRRYRFAASHRLHSTAFSEDENRELYGKCSNPYGHGHDYVLDVTAQGRWIRRRGQVVHVPTLDRLVSEQVLKDFDHRYMNADLEEFRKWFRHRRILSGSLRTGSTPAGPMCFPANGRVWRESGCAKPSETYSN